jgi:hypothetical protein
MEAGRWQSTVRISLDTLTWCRNWYEHIARVQETAGPHEPLKTSAQARRSPNRPGLLRSDRPPSDSVRVTAWADNRLAKGLAGADAHTSEIAAPVPRQRVVTASPNTPVVAARNRCITG